MPHPTRTHRSRRRALGAAALAGVLALGLTGVADAVPGSVDSSGPGVDLANAATWSLYQYPNGVVGMQDGVLINDAAVDGHTDAFDGAFQLVIGTTSFAASGGVVDVAGPKMTVPPVSIGGLKVLATYVALPGTSTMRVLVKLANRGSSRVRRQLLIGTNLGSDTRTTIERTSSGDRTFRVGDRWLITSDTTGVDAPIDPVVGQVFGGKGDVVRRKLATASSGSDSVTSKITLSIPRRTTRYVMFFLRVDTSVSDVREAMGDFNRRGLTRKLLSGIGPSTQRKIINWDL